MNGKQRELAVAVARKLLPASEFERLASIRIHDLGFGYDPFGMEKEAFLLAYAFGRFAYRYYFRAKSSGHENVPLEGRALIVPNHSGTLPVDGMMVMIDLAARLERARASRAVVDNFLGYLPFASTALYRIGQVVGARRNFEDLLEEDDIVTVFPEGGKGLSKRFSQRYRLARFNVGFVELALIHRAPIVPTAIIGGEEQVPMLYNLKPLARAMGLPFFPITPFFPWFGPFALFPLPVQYHIRYGEPMRFHERYGPEAVRSPETVRMLADRVQAKVQEMVDRGLEERTSVFGFRVRPAPPRLPLGVEPERALGSGAALLAEVRARNGPGSDRARLPDGHGGGAPHDPDVETAVPSCASHSGPEID